MDEASEMVPASKWCLFGRTWSASLKTLFAFFSGKIIFTGPALQFSFTFVLLDAGGQPYCASALHWVLGGTQQCWRRCVQNYPGSNPGPSEARKEISRAQAGCSGRAIVPVLLSQLTREEKKNSFWLFLWKDFGYLQKVSRGRICSFFCSLPCRWLPLHEVRHATLPHCCIRSPCRHFAYSPSWYSAWVCMLF